MDFADLATFPATGQRIRMVVGPSGSVGFPPAAGPTSGWRFPARDPVGPPPFHPPRGLLAASGISPFPPFPSATHNFHRHRVTSWGRLPARPASSLTSPPPSPPPTTTSVLSARYPAASRFPFYSCCVVVGAGEPTTPPICLFVLFSN
jgi:hypothetical protein